MFFFFITVQNYIPNPFLIGAPAHKFDLRLYVLLERAWPFRLHIHSRGLVRFASVPYQTGGLENTHSHLTNFTLNKANMPNVGSKKTVASPANASAAAGSASEKTEDAGKGSSGQGASGGGDKNAKDTADASSPSTGLGRGATRADFERPTDGASGPKWLLSELWRYLDERCATFTAAGGARDKKAAAESDAADADADAGAGAGGVRASTPYVLPPRLWAEIKHLVLMAMTPTMMSVLERPHYPPSAVYGNCSSSSSSSSANDAKDVNAVNKTSDDDEDGVSPSHTADGTSGGPAAASSVSAGAGAAGASSASAAAGAGELEPIWGYELLGVDVLIDDRGRPHLLEINRSPAMLVSTPVDAEVKPKVLHDVFNTLRIEERLLRAKAAEFAAAACASKAKPAAGPAAGAANPDDAGSEPVTPGSSTPVSSTAATAAEAAAATAVASASASDAPPNQDSLAAATAAALRTLSLPQGTTEAGAEAAAAALCPRTRRRGKGAVFAATTAWMMHREPALARAVLAAPLAPAASAAGAATENSESTPATAGVAETAPVTRPSPSGPVVIPGANGTTPVSALVKNRALSALRYSAAPCELEPLFPPCPRAYADTAAALGRAHARAHGRAAAAALGGDSDAAVAAEAVWSALGKAAAARAEAAAEEAKTAIETEDGGARVAWKLGAVTAIVAGMTAWWDEAVEAAIEAADEVYAEASQDKGKK